MALWNPWHGCHKLSPGCANCYVYRIDARHGRDSSQVSRNADFDLPAQRSRGEWRLKPGETVYTCFSSDFLLPDADAWRPACWEMMRARPDLDFFFITKRIDRFFVGLPGDWGKGWPNVRVGCTVENRDRAAFRLPIFREAPIAGKVIICEPLLEAVDLSPWLGPWVDGVVAGGESGENARPCHFDWVLELRRQCAERGVPFHFKQTGARFVRGGRLYQIPRPQQAEQARRAGIDFPEVWVDGPKT